MPQRRQRIRGVIRDGALAIGAIALGSTAGLAQVASPAADAGNLELLVKLLGQLGASGCLALLAWFQYTDRGKAADAYAKALAEKEKAHGDAVIAKEAEFGRALAAEKDLRLADAENYQNQLEALREEAAEDRRAFRDATLAAKRPPARAQAATKRKGKTR